MKARLLTVGFLVFSFFSCSEKNTTEKIVGNWLFKFKIHSQTLPFNAEIVERDGKLQFFAVNGDERIRADLFEFRDDSLFIQLPIFNTALIGKLQEGKIEGIYFDYSRKGDYQIPFSASKTFNSRFDMAQPAMAEASGKWRVEFSPDSDNAYAAIGEFTQDGNRAAGTFLTTTGDYRYLDGNVVGDSLFLSCFDGSHAFLFKAKIDGDSIRGDFWSGIHWQEEWVGVRDENFQLPDADELTFLNPGYKSVAFSFPNMEGETVSLSDSEFQDKVVIVQLMGSWCPNCMDETAYLVQLHRKFHEQGLEVISLAFEKSDNAEINLRSLKRLKDHFNVPYDILLAGKASKSEAAEKLPMLNHVLSFPTSIFIDRNGKVRRIHTGFSGPGTGEYYHEFVEETDKFVTQLLIE